MIKSPFIQRKAIQVKPQGNVVDLSGLISKIDELNKLVDSFHLLKQELKDNHDKTIEEMKKEHDLEISRVKELQFINKGEPGESPDIDDIVQKVLSNIPKPKDGNTPVVDKVEIAKMAANFVEIPKIKIPEVKIPKIDHAEIADKVIELIQSGKKKLSTKHIGDFTEGLEQTVRPIRSLMAGFRGGGDVVKAGSNVTITTDANGVKSIASTGGGAATIYSETPTGSINGSNKVYTTAHAVTTVIGFWINGQFIHPAEYTAVGTTVTFVTALDASLSGTGFTISYT